ncbi:50S ribosomal protein L13 [Salmonella enterica subsp. enterica]|nr:50S ribosomal protein L13 [Salmonella enterica subsp. enterica]EAW1698152.1 50S ribosomal protein L13 [Salmonella enterica subsp. enterica]EAW1811719.1 50S ribosomal protein L13 [Salmonella enterica subsp. enterica]
MSWIPVTERLPRPFSRVWVQTDPGKQVTGYVKSNGEWFINCEAVRVSGAKVLRWKDD